MKTLPVHFRLMLKKRVSCYSVLFLIMLAVLLMVNPENLWAEPLNDIPDQMILSWTDDPYTTQTIAWRMTTDTGQERVQYIPAAASQGSFNGAQEETATKSLLYSGYWHFEATLKDLTPGTQYTYRVGRDGAWSESGTFTTPASGSKLSFLYMGDVQQGYENWGKMLLSITEVCPNLKFAVMGGDLVNDGGSSDEWEQFFYAAAPLFKKLPILPAAGNHDDKPWFWTSFALPRNGPEGFKEKFYSFDYGNCHIAVLDSNLMGASGSAYETIKNWLQKDLDGSSKPWKLLVMHYPPYPVAEDGHSDNLQENWVPLFEKCGVDLALVGHQHVYMRSKPLSGGKIPADGQGIVYVMGNAGSKFYPPGDESDYIAKEQAYVSNYEIISIDDDSLNMTAWSNDGQLIDTFTLGNSAQAYAQYVITPLLDTGYQIGNTGGELATMTVASGISGIKYFKVKVTPQKPHEGMETVVFVHMRNGVQLGMNVSRADFDQIDTAQAGFNVVPGDIVKVYVLDYLSNGADINPIVLQ